MIRGSLRKIWGSKRRRSSTSLFFFDVLLSFIYSCHYMLTQCGRNIKQVANSLQVKLQKYLIHCKFDILSLRALRRLNGGKKTVAKKKNNWCNRHEIYFSEGVSAPTLCWISPPRAHKQSNCHSYKVTWLNVRPHYPWNKAGSLHDIKKNRASHSCSHAKQRSQLSGRNSDREKKEHRMLSERPCLSTA